MVRRLLLCTATLYFISSLYYQDIKFLNPIFGYLPYACMSCPNCPIRGSKGRRERIRLLVFSL
jgi:hypothetical protein